MGMVTSNPCTGCCHINSNISSSGEDGKENLKTKIEESVTNSKENRKKYLESLGGN